MMAGEDLLEDGGDSSSAEKPVKGKKPLSKGQKIGVGIGVVTIVLFIYEIQKSKNAAAASATTTAPIDPQTGYPSGSAQDQAALAQMGNASGAYGYQGQGSYGSYPSTGATSTTSGQDPVTGMTYSAEIAANAGGISTLQSDFTQLQGSITSLTSDVQGLSTNANQSPSSGFNQGAGETINNYYTNPPASGGSGAAHPLTIAQAQARIATTNKDIAAAKAMGPAGASKLASAENALKTQTATLHKLQG